VPVVLAGRGVQGCGAGPRGEPVSVREAGDVADDTELDLWAEDMGSDLDAEDRLVLGYDDESLESLPQATDGHD